MPSNDKYTDPKLRSEVKEEIQNGDKGGAPGQWSARKAQFMAQEYKKRGGGYTTDKEHQDESQRHLDKWSEEEWQTKEGSGQAKRDDGTEKRYLPKKAWEGMTKEEKEETERKKLEGGKAGKQYVGNTDKAKQSRKKASKSDGGEKQNGSQKQDEENDNEGEQDQGRDANGSEDDSEEEYVDDGQADADKDGDVDMEDEQAGSEHEDEGEDEDEDEDAEEEEDEHDDKENAQTGQKRKSGKQQKQQPQAANRPSKKQKDNSGNGKPKETVGSKHMDAAEPAPRGSKDDLPKKGQHVTWKAMPGYVDGEVVDVLTADQEVEGKSTKASKDNPKIVLKSDASGKICVHKPDSCYYYI